MSDQLVRIGIVGTSWWADTMYLPPLSRGENCKVVACCGRNRERAEAFATEWDIPHVFTDYGEMFASGLMDAIVVATGNETHYPITMLALEHGLHVLCEKPLALTYSQAAEMAEAATAKGVITSVPFTYRHMPSTRYVKDLMDDGFIGRPYHMHLRYYAGFGRESKYVWRFDKNKAGSGALGDIGSHFIYLAEWFWGEIEAVCSQLGQFVERPDVDPDGNPYEQGDDSAMLMVRFRNGAHGMIHATTLAYEDTPFGQVHEMDFHGSGGTLRQRIDWRERQQVFGARLGEGYSQTLPIPDDYWGSVRREKVIETYKDVFREEGRMVRDFVEAVAAGEPASPDFVDGARIQRILAAALLSQEQARWVSVDEIDSDSGL